MLSLIPRRCAELLVIGAHCDDIAIGAGGALLELCRANPGVRVVALVFTGGGGPREDEERAALAAFCPKAELEVTVLDIPDGRLPVHWERAKEALELVRRGCDPDLVFAPSPHDAHQDHRGVAALVPTAFRNHVVLGYEILKWESDLAQPQVFFPLPEDVLADKVGLLHEHYGSQHGKTWFDEETFAGLARIRGVQCNTRYAEAFHTTKLIMAAGPAGAGS